MAEGAIHVHLRAVAPDLAPLCRITFALAPLPPPLPPQRPARLAPASGARPAKRSAALVECAQAADPAGLLLLGRAEGARCRRRPVWHPPRHRLYRLPLPGAGPSGLGGPQRPQHRMGPGARCAGCAGPGGPTGCVARRSPALPRRVHCTPPRPHCSPCAHGHARRRRLRYARQLRDSPPCFQLVPPPPLAVQLVGGRSVSMVPDPQEHARQRALMLPFFSPDVVAAKMPAIQETVRF